MSSTITLDSQRNGTGTRFLPKENNVPFGDYIIPMLYIWFIGSGGMNKDYDIISKAFDSFVEFNPGGAESQSAKSFVVNNATKLKSLLISSSLKNQSFLRALVSAATLSCSQYGDRFPKTGSFYKAPDGSFSAVPLSSAFDDPEKKLATAMEIYYIMLSGGLIDFTAQTGINPINIYTGEFYTEDTTTTTSTNARIIGLPSSGIFTVNNRKKTGYYQRTFTGVDAVCLASTGNVVSELNGLTSLSWSVHRGKSTPRILGKPSPSIRSRGARTIAGTMIFTVSDHHPLLDLIPGDISSVRSMSLTIGQKDWRQIMMADQLPPFDLTVVLMNEYGMCSILIIYGIDVVDEGSVISIDNLLTEISVQYVAVGMDPIYEVPADDLAGNVIVDPYGIVKGNGEEFARRRDVVMKGFAYSDYEAAYDAYYRSIAGVSGGETRRVKQ